MLAIANFELIYQHLVVKHLHLVWRYIAITLDYFVQYCAPTLAGLKASSLFSYKYKNTDDLEKSIASFNTLINPKGVYVDILKSTDNFALIFVYRRAKLQALLNRVEIQDFLSTYGYNDFTINGCLQVLESNTNSTCFPHEIGVFLEYPLNDVKSFIAKKGMDYKCVGCWKAYHNKNEAQKTFSLYEKCTRVYCQKVEQGFDVNRLTVVG